MSTSPLVLGLGACVALAACAPNLLRAPISQQHDRWSVTLTRLDDGPNQIAPSGYTAYLPPSGDRLLHATIEIENAAPEPRLFDYAQCTLDHDGLEARPGLVTTRSGIWMVIDPVEQLSAGRSTTRMLTYSYPELRYPTRLTCPGMRFDIPAPATR